MRITQDAPKPVPVSYTLVLSEAEMQGLRALAFNGNSINTNDHRGGLSSDGDPAQIHSVLRTLWVETNQFIDFWKRNR